MMNEPTPPLEVRTGAPEHRVALVTGAARGIGRAIALGLASRGWSIAVHYRESTIDAEETVALAFAAGAPSAIAVPADITQPGQAERLVAGTAKRLRGLHAVVHNVGNYLKKPIEDLEVDEWHAMLDSNLNSVFYLTQAALPHMRSAGWGRVVSLGYAGSSNLVARPTVTAYGIAKTGVVLLMKAYAKRLAASGITFNIVAPGVVETSISKPLSEIPACRLATVREIVDPVLYLCSDEAAYVTGQVIEVAGGYNL